MVSMLCCAELRRGMLKAEDRLLDQLGRIHKIHKLVFIIFCHSYERCSSLQLLCDPRSSILTWKKITPLTHFGLQSTVCRLDFDGWEGQQTLPACRATVLIIRKQMSVDSFLQRSFSFPNFHCAVTVTKTKQQTPSHRNPCWLQNVIYFTRLSVFCSSHSPASWQTWES